MNVSAITGFVRGREYTPRSFCFSFLLLFFWSLTFSNALAEISFTAALILYVFDLAKTRRLPLEGFDRTSAICLLGFTVIAVLSYFWSEAKDQSFRGVFKVLQQVMVFVMTADVMKSGFKFGTIERVVFAVLALTSINCIFQYITGWDFIRGNEYTEARAGNRISASFRTYGQLAAFLIMTIPFIAAAGLACKGKSPWRIGMWAVSVLALLCLFLTRSRGAMAAFAAGLLLIALMLRNRKLIIALLILIAASVLMMPRSMLIHLDVENKEQSIVERFYLWDRAANVIKAKPLTGTGINTYLSTHAKYDTTRNWRVTDYYAHNGYLQMGAEIGLPGLLFFVAFLLAQLRLNWKRAAADASPRRWAALGLWAGVLNFMLFAAVDTSLHSMQSVMTFWFFLGLLSAYGSGADEKLPLSTNADAAR